MNGSICPRRGRGLIEIVVRTPEDIYRQRRHRADSELAKQTGKVSQMLRKQIARDDPPALSLIPHVNKRRPEFKMLVQLHPIPLAPGVFFHVSAVRRNSIFLVS